MAEIKQQKFEDVIAGRNAVREALRSGRAVESVLVAKGERNGAIASVVSLARELKIPVKETDPRKLDSLCPGANHQGVAALAAAHEYAELEDIFQLAEARGEAPFIVVLDEIEDPHNLGAIIRTAECAGAHGVMIPKRRAAGLTYAVGKASAGALEYVPVVRVVNLSAALQDLKKRGLWVYGTDMEGTPWCQADLTGPAALVIGSEGAGIGRLVKEQCDAVISIPMRGKINSLNASVAAGVAMYEIARQRLGMNAK